MPKILPCGCVLSSLRCVHELVKVTMPIPASISTLDLMTQPIPEITEVGEIPASVVAPSVFQPMVLQPVFAGTMPVISPKEPLTLCNGKKKDGSPCTSKGKFDGFCGTHKGQSVAWISTHPPPPPAPEKPIDESPMGYFNNCPGQFQTAGVLAHLIQNGYDVDFRVISVTGPFYVWDSKKMIWDISNIELFASRFGLFLHSCVQLLVRDLDDKANKTFMRSISGKTSMLDIAKLTIPFIADPEFETMINTGKDLLPVGDNKVVNMRTGELRPREKDDYFTQTIKTPYKPEAKSTVLDKFLSEITCKDEAYLLNLQVLVGYMFTGYTVEHIMIIIKGVTRNGKGAFVALMKMLSDKYVKTGNKSIIDAGARAKGAPAADLEKMEFARIIHFDELKKGAQLDDQNIKSWVGGGDAPFRRVYGTKEIDLVLQCVFMVTTNHYPQANDEAWYERLFSLPFYAYFTENPDPSQSNQFKKDQFLLDKLNTPEVLEAFLAWIIEGSKRYFAEGLKWCPAVQESTRQMLVEMKAKNNSGSSLLDGTVL